MSIVFNIPVQYGFLIDRTDVWVLQHIRDNGCTGVFRTSNDQEVVLRTGQQSRVAPGLRLGLMKPSKLGEVRLVIDAYIPLIQCHGPDVPHPVSKGGIV